MLADWSIHWNILYIGNKFQLDLITMLVYGNKWGHFDSCMTTTVASRNML